MLRLVITCISTLKFLISITSHIIFDSCHQIDFGSAEIRGSSSSPDSPEEALYLDINVITSYLFSRFFVLSTRNYAHAKIALE